MGHDDLGTFTGMRKSVRLRALDGPVVELAIDGAYFANADRVSVAGELDTKNWFAVPGLVDAHAHLGASSVDDQLTFDETESLLASYTNMWAQLASGVFLVFDKGGRSDARLRLASEPPALRPQLSMAGRMIAAPDGYFRGFAHEVDPDGLADYVSTVVGSGARWIKLVGDWPRRGRGAIPNFTEEQLAQAVSVAHTAGLRVAIHTAAPGTPSLAVRAGVDSIEHGLFLTEEDLTELGRRRGAWVPTIRAMESVGASLGLDSSGGKLFAEGLANVRELLSSATAKGVLAMCGTDLSLAHGEVAHEAVRMVEYGMSTVDAFHAATTVGLRYDGRPTSFRAGLPASAVFFDGDPRDDIAVLTRPAMVMHHGRIVSGG